MKITLVKTKVFQANVSSLSADEQRALYLVLAEDPLKGTPHSTFPEILEFGPFCKHYVYYFIVPSMDEMNEIILLDIGKSELPLPSAKEKLELEKWIKEGVKKGFIAGAIYLAKKGADVIWEIVKAHFP